MTEKKKQMKGFAVMSPERRKEIAAMGGRSVPADRRSFSINNELARKAGQKGGMSVAPENRSFAKDPQLAVDANRRGLIVRQEKTK